MIQIARWAVRVILVSCMTMLMFRMLAVLASTNFDGDIRGIALVVSAISGISTGMFFAIERLDK